MAEIQWLVQTESGKTLGPYSTKQVLDLISSGALVGTEKIKRHPDGKWIPISKQADFYDKLLQILEDKDADRKNSEEASFSEEEPLPHFEETVIVPLPKVKKEKELVKEEKSKFTVNEKNFVKSPPPVVPMQTPLELKKRAKKKSFFAPILLIIVSLGLVLVTFLWPEGKQKTVEGKVNLLIPQTGKANTLSADEVKEKFRRAVAFFVKDTYEDYTESEKLLVQISESATQNAEARGFLCLVYKELWPFVKQDSKDFTAVQIVSQSARSLDPVGINGVYCEASKLMIYGKYKEARGVVENALNQPATSIAPVLYQIKAEILFEGRDTKTAFLYAEKAKQLWPEWIKPVFSLGQYATENQNPSEAFKYYEQVRQMNEKHKPAQLEQGLLLYENFSRKEEAYKLLTAALNSRGLVKASLESKASFLVADYLVEKKNLKDAKKYAQRAFELNPSNKTFKDLFIQLGGNLEKIPSGKNNELIFVGDQYYRTGNFLAAQAEYKTAFELDPKNGLAAVKAAECLWKLNQGQEAISWLEKAIRSDSKLVMAYVLLADYQSARYNYVAATQALNQAGKYFPNNNEILRSYGLIEYRRNNMKDALAFLTRSHKAFENDSETLILLAKAYSAIQDFSSAQKYAVRAIELDSTNNEAQIIYAKILTQFQGLDTGVLYIKELIKKYSYSIDFRLALADMYREQERQRQAQEIYEQIVDANPKNKEAFIGLGLSLQAQGLFDPALRAYLSAAVLDPSDAEPLMKAGLLYLDMGKYSDAIIQLKRALSVNPLLPRGNYFVGRAAFLNGEYDLALKSANEERKINPNIADSYILAAEVYAASKQFQKCSVEYQQAINLRPQGAAIYVKLARCYRQGGSPDIAESMLNIAAGQESGLPDIYKEQGAIFEQKGDRRAAVQAYNKYLGLSPNAPDRREIEARILSISQGK